MAINKKSINISAGGGVEKRAPSYTVGGNVMVQPLRTIASRFLKKLKTGLLSDPAILFLGIYLEKMITLIYIDVCTPVFMAAL